jgi:glycosyltransferase involved in cell wall biosynthesis
MDLSIIVISRNEERIIGACIESLLEQRSGLETEIILVDSASTDRTVEIAARYHVTIVCIDPAAALSPSAGRYLGTQYATGNYILFLDGDMILIQDWVRNALPYLQNETVGAVGGRLYRVYPGEELNYIHQDSDPLGSVDRLGGAGLYRRDVLMKTGSFNPFVKGEEERELGFRINKAGFAILRVDVPMVFHMEKPPTRSERDEKAKHFAGVGQNIRRYGLRKISWELLWAHRAAFRAHAVVFLAGALLISLLAAGQIMLFTAAAALMALIILVLMLVKGRRKVYLFFRFGFLVLVNLWQGLRLGIPSPNEFKMRTSVLSRLGRN